MMQRPSRRVGITILAVLEILIGIVGLLSSLAIIGFSALFSTLPTVGSLIGAVGLIIGGVVLFFSVIWLATVVGGSPSHVSASLTRIINDPRINEPRPINSTILQPGQRRQSPGLSLLPHDPSDGHKEMSHLWSSHLAPFIVTNSSEQSQIRNPEASSKTHD